MKQEQLPSRTLELEENPVKERHGTGRSQERNRERSLSGQQALALHQRSRKLPRQIACEPRGPGVGPAGNQLEVRPERRPFQPGGPKQGQTIPGHRRQGDHAVLMGNPTAVEIRCEEAGMLPEEVEQRGQVGRMPDGEDFELRLCDQGRRQHQLEEEGIANPLEPGGKDEAAA